MNLNDNQKMMLFQLAEDYVNKNPQRYTEKEKKQFLRFLFLQKHHLMKEMNQRIRNGQNFVQMCVLVD